ncbi:hypothetical protein IWQ61_003024 [Dispira simplex]|nr:hypothetical protein IWQ61_003024 [Dispira simplex]
MEAIITEAERLAEKQKTNDALVRTLLNQVVDQITAFQAKTRENTASVPPLMDVVKIQSQLKTLVPKIIEKHKEFYNNISKHGKAIDKAFKVTLDDFSGSKTFESDDKLVVTSIALEFIRQGEFELCDQLLSEAGLEIPPQIQQGFQDMFKYIEFIRQRNVQPVLTWVHENREALGPTGMDLEFSLHKMHFIQLLTSGHHIEALDYSKQTMSSFVGRDKYFKQISQLTCAVIYINHLEHSPYARLLDPLLWTELEHQVTSSFCKKLDLAENSPLYLSVTIGVIALPTMIKMSTLMKDKKTEWSQQDELPIEVPLPEELRFHSTFICPVSKERATEENPPMMLPCGHVLCMESLRRLYKGNRGGNSQTTRFKCPYCPQYTTADEAQRVYF